MPSMVSQGETNTSEIVESDIMAPRVPVSAKKKSVEVGSTKNSSREKHKISEVDTVNATSPSSASQVHMYTRTRLRQVPIKFFAKGNNSHPTLANICKGMATDSKPEFHQRWCQLNPLKKQLNLESLFLTGYIVGVLDTSLTNVQMYGFRFHTLNLSLCFSVSDIGITTIISGGASLECLNLSSPTQFPWDMLQTLKHSKYPVVIKLGWDMLQTLKSLTLRRAAWLTMKP
ncbi:VP1/ABI3-like protein 3 [Tanacetum coccineum]